MKFLDYFLIFALGNLNCFVAMMYFALRVNHKRIVKKDKGEQ